MKLHINMHESFSQLFILFLTKLPVLIMRYQYYVFIPIQLALFAP